MLDEEKPDLVVFTGDQLNGQETSWDSKSVIAKVVGPVVDRKIPWTAIFGEFCTFFCFCFFSLGDEAE
jgi:hypothetical protein